MESFSETSSLISPAPIQETEQHPLQQPVVAPGTALSSSLERMTATQAEASHLINSDRTTARMQFLNSHSNNGYNAANGRSMERGLTSMFKGLKLNEGEKPHNCTHCSYKGATASDLKIHIVDVHEEKKPPNRLCETAEASSSGSAVTPMYRDLKINTRETPYVSLRCQFRADIPPESDMPNQCRSCGFRALTPVDFRAHVYDCHKAHQCTHCSYKGTTASDLKIHIVDVHEEKKPHIPLCETAKASSSGSAVKPMFRYLKINTRPTPYVSLRCQFRADIPPESDMPNQCRSCGFRALTPVDFRAHVYDCHKAHQCTHCSYKGTTASDLKIHIVDVHEEKKPHNPLCETAKASGSGSAVKPMFRYLKINTRPTPYVSLRCQFRADIPPESDMPNQCRSCGFRALTPVDFRAHVYDCHKAHQCTHCSYKGTTASDLKIHIVDVHEEKKPHNRLCETAKASSSGSAVTPMYRDLKINTRGSPYVCMQCCYNVDINAESEMSNKRRICGFEALTPVDFKTHVYVCQKAHQCTHCNYTTSSASLMKKHVRIIHKNTKPLKIYVHKSKTSHERCCQLRRAQDMKARGLEGKVTSMLGDLKLN